MKIAVTIDDIPATGDLPPGVSRSDITRGIIEALKDNGISGTYGFANHFAGLDDVAKLWLSSGNPLGNHTYDHLDLGTVSVQRYVANVALMNQKLEDLKPFSSLIAHRFFFRFPFLEEGKTLEERDAVRAYLFANGYKIAEVTIDYEDWNWNAAYVRCERQRDYKSVAWLKDHVTEAAERNLRRSRALSELLFHRNIAQILLLHNNAFTAQVLDRVLRDLRLQRVKFITLEQALSDPAYRVNPNKGFPIGLTFLEQIAAARSVDIDRFEDVKYSLGVISRVCAPSPPGR
jgi:peptidoglycan/xylan/chitin deacetylase (PgdA/CDA1 family)